MKKLIYIYVLVFVFLTCSFACCFNYPIFSELSSISSKDQKYINDIHESEKINSISKQKIVFNHSWFEIMNYNFNFNKVYTIIDLKTSKSFKVIRTGGSNHADVETVDAENTKLLLEICDNRWSWNRRPILLKLDNHYIAGSISALPHGYDSIENNQVIGHFCIHFKNSKTHGTDVIDLAHQNSIDKALQLSEEYFKNISPVEIIATN